MNTLSVKTRLGLIVAALLAFLALSSGMGMLRLGQANATIEALYHERVVCLSGIAAVSTGFSVDIADAASKAADGAMTPPDAAAAIAAARERIDSAWHDCAASGGETALVEQAEPLERQADAAVAVLLQRLRVGDVDGVRGFVSHDMHGAFAPLLSALGELASRHAEDARQDYTRTHAVFERALSAHAAVTAFALVAGALTCWLLIRSITGPLAQAVRVAENVAAGDLTSRIEVAGRDETSQMLAALERMNGSLSGIVGGVRAGSEAIGAAAAQIAAGNADLSSRTEQQAAALEETAASMAQLTSTVRQNADSARDASRLAGEAREIAGRSNAAVALVAGTMGEIRASAAKIADIIGIIEGIAFQTNILALNAAVEAARAGDGGRGFAVVAGDVRALAQRSSGAAKEIKALIDASTSSVAAGAKLADGARATMAEAIEAVSRVTQIVGEIAAASDEQSRGIVQVGQAIAQMDAVTQQNAALVEEAAAAAQSLRDQAIRLDAAVAVFTVSPGATAAARSGAARGDWAEAGVAFDAEGRPA